MDKKLRKILRKKDTKERLTEEESIHLLDETLRILAELDKATVRNMEIAKELMVKKERIKNKDDDGRNLKLAYLNLAVAIDTMDGEHAAKILKTIIKLERDHAERSKLDEEKT